MVCTGFDASSGCNTFLKKSNALTYKWIAPSGITLSSTTIAKPTFTAPEVAGKTPFEFSLVVNDGKVNSEASKVTVNVLNVESNQKPIANAGSNQAVKVTDKVILNGTGSYDADGDDLSFKWTAPDGIALSSTTVEKPTFIAPEVDDDTPFKFTLVVNDGKVNSEVSTVTITVEKDVNVGVNEVTDKVFLVYPNPFENELFVEIDSYSDKAEYELLTVNSQLIQSGEVTKKTIINTGDLKLGIYLLKIKSGENYEVKKLVKQ